MIIFYDFDGTLTPYSFPKYEILKKCNVDNESFMKLVKIRMDKYNIDLYKAYYESFFDLIKDSGYLLTKDNICTGSKDIEFNNGVFEFFNFFTKENIYHYIVTSGIEEYVKDTKISKYVTGIFGSTFSYHKDSYKVNRLVTSNDKVEVIKKVLEKYRDVDIFYLGDGLTDMEAFEYIHSIGGKSIFLSNDLVNDEIYKMLKEKDIIDECFKPDFSIEGSIFQYFNNILNRRD